MQRSVNPSPFGIKFGIEYLFMAVLGGVGSVWGAFTGAALVKLTEEQLQVLLPKLIGTAGSYEIIIFGTVARSATNSAAVSGINSSTSTRTTISSAYCVRP